MINFSSYIPLYIQLHDVLKEKIESKEWTDGARLPGENELCQEYRVSRTVVRQALLELEMTGYIIRRKGRGTFANSAKVNEGLAQNLTGFYEDMVERGQNQKTVVLNTSTILADSYLAQKLGVNVGNPIIEIRRQRFVNNEPLVVVTSYLPAHLCPQLIKTDLTDRSLYSYLETECKLTASRAYRTIEACLASREDAEYLGINAGDPVIRLESVSYLENGLPFEFYRAFHRGDRARFEINLMRVHDKWRTIE